MFVSVPLDYGNITKGGLTIKKLSEIKLAKNQLDGLVKLRRRLFANFDVNKMFLFGSVARGEADEESDVDLLILTLRRYDRPEVHQITDLIFEINLEYDTNFSAIVVEQKDWDAGTMSVLPIHDDILKEGIAV